MKIAFVTPEYYPFQKGGCGISAELFVRILKNNGIYVDVFVFDKARDSEQSDMGNVYYFEVSPPTQIQYDIQTFKTLFGKMGQYDLIHVIGERQMFSLKLLQILTHHIPIVSTLNGFSGACYNYQRFVLLDCNNCNLLSLYKCILYKKEKNSRKSQVESLANLILYRIRQFFSKKIDYFFVLSEPIKRMYISAGYPVSRMYVIPNMIDPIYLQKLEGYHCEESSLINRNITILYVGRLSPEKGVSDLLRAFSILKPKRNVSLEIAGCGPDELYLKEFTKQLGIENSVVFLGNVDYTKIYSIYKRADIFVHPGRWPEAFGRTIIEALVCGIPVVCSNIGAPPIIVNDSGLIYKVGDINDLADKLIFLIENTEFRKNLSKKAMSNASKYTVGENIGQILEKYQYILSR